MTPRELYELLAKYQGVTTSNICAVRQVCKQYEGCKNKSKSVLLDFDGAAHTYQQSAQRKRTPPTVDAIAITSAEELLVLIEKKTWEIFLDRLPEEDKMNPLAAAMKKTASYDIKGKYWETRKICDHVSHIPNLFMTMPHVFVFLSEFSDNHVMGGFLSMMEDLSHTSSNVDFVLQANIVKGMKAQLNTVHCRRHRYLNCMELDSFLMNPQKFEGK